eukprot:m.355010 g.355010  ORF g.355010 m.355010 type:complete len:238 (+) comp17154_c0_seq1:404-1117(+)
MPTQRPNKEHQLTTATPVASHPTSIISLSPSSATQKPATTTSMEVVLDLNEYNIGRWEMKAASRKRRQIQRSAGVKAGAISWRNVAVVTKQVLPSRPKGQLDAERLRTYETRLGAREPPVPVELAAEDMYAPGASECECGKSQSRLCRSGKCSVSLALAAEKEHQAQLKDAQSKRKCKSSKATSTSSDVTEYQSAEARQALKQHQRSLQREARRIRLESKAWKKKGHSAMQKSRTTS